MPVSDVYEVTRNTMIAIGQATRAINPDINISYSPQPLSYSQQNNGVDYTDFLRDGIVNEVGLIFIDCE